jgi:muconate cycloisomerase
MADESVVTFEDAQELIAHKACDYFNLRIAKCGGIVGTLGIANLASQSGVKTQLGCLVGETAVLSAAGRHLAAYLPDIEFVEGSYSTWLLEKDISTVPIAFGAEGQAPILAGSGLGISVDRNTMERYAHDILHIV